MDENLKPSQQASDNSNSIPDSLKPNAPDLIGAKAQNTSNLVKLSSKLLKKIIIGIFTLLIIVVIVVGYIFKDKISNSTSTKLPKEKNDMINKNLNPNTGSLYKDVAQRLKEELK